MKQFLVLSGLIRTNVMSKAPSIFLNKSPAAGQQVSSDMLLDQGFTISEGIVDGNLHSSVFTALLLKLGPTNGNKISRADRAVGRHTHMANIRILIEGSNSIVKVRSIPLFASNRVQDEMNKFFEICVRNKTNACRNQPSSQYVPSRESTPKQRRSYKEAIKQPYP